MGLRRRRHEHPSKPHPPVASHSNARTYTVRLTVTGVDATGHSHSDYTEEQLTVAAAGTNISPVTSLAASPSSLDVGQQVSFTSTSHDPDGFVYKWHWDFGDGTSQDTTMATTTHTYMAASTPTATVTVTDNGGANSVTRTLTVNVQAQNQPPVVDAGPDQTVNPGDSVILHGTATDADGDTLLIGWDSSPHVDSLTPRR